MRIGCFTSHPSLEKSDGWGTRALSLKEKRTNNDNSSNNKQRQQTTTTAATTATTTADSSAALRNDKLGGGMTTKRQNDKHTARRTTKYRQMKIAEARRWPPGFLIDLYNYYFTMGSISSMPLAGKKFLLCFVVDEWISRCRGG